MKKQHIPCSLNRVARLMQLNEIAAKRKRKFVLTTNSNYNLPIAENKLNQDFTATKSNQVGH
jgi:transposase InsO family protein